MSESHRQSDLLDHLFWHGIDLRERRIFFTGGVHDADEEEALVHYVLRSLKFIDKSQSDRSIQLWIHTLGGDEPTMFALYDAIRCCKSNVITIGTGEISSAGCLLLVAGDERYVTPSAWFMSHFGSVGGIDGLDKRDAKRRVDWSHRMGSQWATLMAEHTNHDKKWWMEKTRDGEFWLSASQMAQKQHGIVDGIWDARMARRKK